MAHERPALLPALGFVAGIALATGDAPSISIGAGLAAAAAARHPPTVRVAWLTLLLVAIGMLLGHRDLRETHELRQAVAAGPSIEPLETHLVGELLSAVEPEHDGGRRLLLRVPVARRRGIVELRVRASATDATRRLDAMRPGDTVRAFASLRFDEDRARLQRLRIRGAQIAGGVRSARAVERLQVGPRSITRIVAALRARCRRVLRANARATTGESALVAALVVGDRRLLPPSVSEAMREAGWLHLVAISGLHVGLLAVAARQTLGRRLRRPWSRAGLGALALLAFSSFVGGGPSVARASCVAAAVLIGRALGRGGDPLNTLAWLAALVLAARPAWVASAGFQLTCVATWGLLVPGRRLADALPTGLPCRGALGISAGAYASSAPVAAAQFGLLAPLGALSHLLGLPLVATVLLTGWLETSVGLALPVVRVTTAVSRLFAGLTLDCARAFGEWHGASAVAAPAPPVLAVALATLAGASCGPRWSRLTCGWLAGAVCLWIHLGPPALPAPSTRVVAFDVGQGSSTWVRGRDGGELLVDAGGSFRAGWDPGARVVVPRLRAAGLRRLDALFVSHGDADHAGGASAVLRRFEIAELYLPRGWSADPRLVALAASARRRGSAIVTQRPGQQTRVPGLRVVTLAGGAATSIEASSNDASLVLRIDDGDAALLIPGDIGCAVEQRLLRSGETLSAGLLIVAHHGSRGSSCDAFLDAVRPRHAAISSGRRNRFGHPHPELLRRLRRRGLALGITARDGELRYESSGPGWRFSRRR